MILKRIKSLYDNSGPLLFFFRIPSRFFKTILNRITTFYYSLILAEMGNSVRIEFGVTIENPSNVSLGDNVYIGKGTKIIAENSIGILTISDFVHIGNNCHIDHTGNLTIESYTLFSENVFVFSHSHGFNPRSKPRAIDKYIQSHCWFGVSSIICENVTNIASYSIVGAGSVLTKNIESDHCVYAGVPAKEIKKYVN